MDDKSSNPMSDGVRANNKKPLDWVSIGLSGVAAVLIVIGIFFLSQSVSLLTPTKTANSANSSSSVSRSSVSSVSSTASSSSVSSVVSSSSVASVIPPPVPVVPAFDPATAPLKTGSTNAEIKMTITASNTNTVGGSVVETGFTGTRWFARAGISWPSFDATKFVPAALVGETWRVELIITEDQTTGAIANPGAITVVKAYKL